MRNKKRAPIVLERWFGPPGSKTESLASEEQGVGSEDCPGRAKEGRSKNAVDSHTQEQ